MKKGPLQPFDTPGRVSLIGQNYPLIIASTLALSAAIVLSNLSRLPGTTAFSDLTNGMPHKGELGFGKFFIRGITYYFEYPFRLDERTFWSSLTPWLCYIPHQLLQFYIIYKAKEAKAKGNLEWTPSDRWNPYALKMFHINLFFVFIHYFQSRFFYDGLAATFPEISTLFAGVSALIVPFIFEFKRRGVFFYWTPVEYKDAIFEFSKFVREYHAYLASFGIVLTFWYHTMEATFAHWTGFIHIFLLLWQSSMIYQKSHRNRYWTFLLEFWILVHAVVVSYYQGALDGALSVMFHTSFTLLILIGPFWGLPFVQQFLANDESKLRYKCLLVSSLASFAVFAFYRFYNNHSLQYSFLIISLPMLYYFFIVWYYGFYVLGKRLDKFIEEKKLVIRKSKIWWSLMSTVGASSICLIMFLAEFIYRRFIPYS